MNISIVVGLILKESKSDYRTEDFGSNEAIALLRRMSHLPNTLDFTGQTGIVSPMLQQMKSKSIYFQKLLEKGFLLNNLDTDLLNLNGVTVTKMFLSF